MQPQELIAVSDLISGVNQINPRELKFIAEKMDFHLEKAVEGLRKLEELYGQYAEDARSKIHE